MTWQRPFSRLRIAGLPGPFFDAFSKNEALIATVSGKNWKVGQVSKSERAALREVMRAHLAEIARVVAHFVEPGILTKKPRGGMTIAELMDSVAKKDWRTKEFEPDEVAAVCFAMDNFNARK